MQKTELKFNSQICTTKEQSQRLLELGLKPETADMVLIKELAYDEVAHCTYDADTYMIRPIDYLEGEKHRGHIPAWSLHRLKCLLPTKIPYASGYLTIEIINNVNLMFMTDTSEQRVISFIHEDLYESMIKCIKWLINENYFNKEYLKQ